MTRRRSFTARLRRSLRSIGTKLVALTALVIVATIVLLVWQWTQATRELLYTAKEIDAKGTATTVSHTIMNEIDDAVNVASRVESMTKDHHVHVLITGEIVARLRDASAFALRPIAMGVMVRGRDEPIDLYTIDEPPPRLLEA